MKSPLAQFTLYGFLLYFLSGLVQSLAMRSILGRMEVNLMSIRRQPFSELFPLSGVESVDNPMKSSSFSRDQVAQNTSYERAVDSRSQRRPYKCPNQLLLHYCRNHQIVPSCSDSSNVILFVVNFHNPFYSLLPFFEESYFATFCRLFAYDFDFVFVGPYDGYENVLGNGLETKGYYSYMSLIRVWEYLGRSAFSYLGFYLMNDDSCLNPLLLNSFNFSKSFTEGSSLYDTSSRWFWNQERNSRGILFSVAFMKAVCAIAEAQPRYQECLKKENWKYGWSDSFYVTQKDIPQVYYFFNAMFDKRVFLEVAVPTSMNCIGADAIESCNHNGNRSVLNYHLHPVKFSKEENRVLCIERMNMSSLFV